MYFIFTSSSFTVGPVGFPTMGTAAYRLIVLPCFGSHLSPPGVLHAQMSRETSGRESGTVVEALRYKPEGCHINSRRCHWNFSLT
jgi:hypothetical protein